WSKLLVNAGINALTAIHHCPNGKLLESEDTKDMLIAAVREGETVARRLNVALIDDPLAMTLDVCRKTAQNISSMLQDVNNKRFTEIDSINGVIVTAGKKLGITTPVNAELVQKVKEIEQKYLYLNNQLYRYDRKNKSG
ncbi:MAG: ketopantoate reductase family protein, partial [Desulfobulbales bacterium]